MITILLTAAAHKKNITIFFYFFFENCIVYFETYCKLSWWGVQIEEGKEESYQPQIILGVNYIWYPIRAWESCAE